jgi:hypothetical protein
MWNELDAAVHEIETTRMRPLDSTSAQVEKPPPADLVLSMERKTGFEPATLTLAR